MYYTELRGPLLYQAMDGGVLEQCEVSMHKQIGSELGFRNIINTCTKPCIADPFPPFYKLRGELGEKRSGTRVLIYCKWPG